MSLNCWERWFMFECLLIAIIEGKRNKALKHWIYNLNEVMQLVANKQATRETSVFGTSFVALKHRIDTLWSFCHELKMMGVPIFG